MNEHSDASHDWDALRARIIGFGERSIRKSHYPELERRLVELERFRALLDQSNDLIFLAQIPSGHFADVNESSCRQLGYSREALLALSLVDLVPGAVWEEMGLLFAREGQTCQDEKTVVTTLRCPRGDLPVEISVRRVALGGVLYAVIVARDISERVRAEAEQQKAQAFLETAIAQSPSGILIADAPDVTIRLANAAAFDIRGGSRELLTGIKMAEHAAKWQTFRPDGSRYQPEQLPLSRAVFEGEVIQGEEAIIRDAEGHDRWVSTNAAPIRDAEGNITAGIAVLHEITDRKRAEAAVSEAVQQWQATFDAANDAIFILDGDCHILRSNEAATRLFQRPGGELLGNHCWRVVHGTTEPIPECPTPRAKRSLHRESMELRIGDDWLQVTVDPILDSTGQYCGAVHIARNITASKRAEEALRESEGRLREAQQMAHLGHWYWDVKTGAVEWSEEVYKIFRLRPEEFTPQIDSILALSPWPEDHQRDQELIRRAMENHRPGSYEQRFLYPDGSTGYYYSTFQGIYDDQGNLTAMKGTVQDITERKRAEAAVVGLSKFPSENPSPVLRIGTDGAIVYHNAASSGLVQSWGCAEGSLLPASMKAVVEAVLEAGEPKEIEAECCNRVFALTFAPIKDMGYVNIYGLDITERKRAEETVRSSEEKFRTLFDLSPYSIVVTDLHGRILACNKQFSRLHVTREGPEAQVGRHISAFLATDERTRLQAQIRDVVARNRGPVTAEYTMLRDDGTSFPAEATAKALLDENGQPTAILAMGHDITERRRAEQERLDYQRKLRSLASELSLVEERERHRIATGLHDNACQTLVLSRMKLQGLRQSLPPDCMDEITAICHTLDRTNEDIRRLIFDLSSPTLYRFGLEPALEELLEDRLQLEHGIHCTFCDDGAPKPLAQDVRILLFQSVRELVINIVKHAQAQEVTLEIERCGDSVKITITDDGAGFDVADVFAAPSRSRGFGLFNIKERLDYIGGSLDMHSRHGQGSRFILTARLDTEKSDRSDVSRCAPVS